MSQSGDNEAEEDVEAEGEADANTVSSYTKTTTIMDGMTTVEMETTTITNNCDGTETVVVVKSSSVTDEDGNLVSEASEELSNETQDTDK